MIKKDRIAIVFSVPFLMLTLFVIIESPTEVFEVSMLILFPVFAYWSYRFIKGDISFIKSSRKEEV
jgi:hypothetical protein